MICFIRYLRSAMLIVMISGLVFSPAMVSAAGPFIFEQPPGHSGGFSSDGTALVVADEFKFGESTLITSVTWWGGYMDPGVPLSDHFQILFFEDRSGQPGALLAAFSAGAASRTATGDWSLVPDPITKFEGREEFKYSYALPNPVWVGANKTYWLSIVNVPSSGTWMWEVSGSLEYLGVQRSSHGGPWMPYFDNTSFVLMGTPSSP